MAQSLPSTLLSSLPSSLGALPTSLGLPSGLSGLSAMAQSLPSTLLSSLPSSLGALPTSLGALPSLVSTLPSQKSSLVPTGIDSIQNLTTVLTKQKDFLPSQKTQLVSNLRSTFLPVPFGRKETISTQVPGPSDEPVRQVEGTKISQRGRRISRSYDSTQKETIGI